MGVPVQGSPDAPGGDPNYFNFPTTEAMAPTTVMILAHNNSFSITALVYVL